MAVAPNGDPVVTGCVHGQGYESITTMRYDGETGALLWTALYPVSRSGDDGAAAIAIDGSGNVLIAGRSYDGNGKKMRVVKYEGGTGAQLWTAAFVAYGAALANAIALDGDGNVLVTGESSDEQGGRNIRTLKLDGQTGVQRWTSSFAGTVGGFDIGQAIVADVRGDVYVTGLSGEEIGGSNMRTIKYDGASGAMLWKNELGVRGDDSGLDIGIGPDGDPVVFGYSYEPTGSEYRAIKLDRSSGSVRWTTVVPLAPARGDGGEALAFDHSGDIFVTGLANNFASGQRYDMGTAKLRGTTGAVVWHALYSGAAAGDDNAVSLDVDTNGDVVVTGFSQETNLSSTSRTIKYRGSDGAVLWSMAGSDPQGDSGRAVRFDSNGDALVAASVNSNVGYGFKVTKYAGGNGAVRWVSQPKLNDSLPLALTGLWWNPSESGWGIHFTQRRNIVFAAWFTYDAAGKPKWYVASGCRLPAANPSGSCTDSLYEVNGPTFFGPPFDPGAVNIAPVGSVRFDFANPNSGSMTYTVAGQTRTVAIVRQELPAGTVQPPVNFSDLWWNPNESGWGMAISHSYDVMFLAWFVYDGSGKPTWLVASNCALNVTRDGCTGPLYRTTGPAFGPTFDPQAVHVTPVGSVTLESYDANALTIRYTVDGVEGTKGVVRQLF